MAEGIEKLLPIALLGVGGYFVYKWWTTPAAATTQPAPTPGTTSTMTQGQQPTSVSTAPTSTSIIPSVAALQNALGMTMATTDQWNYAFAGLVGRGIEEIYGFDFGTVYGGTAGGGRLISAQAFLNLAAGTGLVPHLNVTLKGLGRIATYPGMFMATQGNLIYRAHHPLPYTRTYALRGFTTATGFEKALLAGRPLMSNKLLGR